jgi:hypothetical protein
MTAPLRRAHLWTWVVVATAMVVLIASALAGRRNATTNNDGIRWEDLR